MIDELLQYRSLSIPRVIIHQLIKCVIHIVNLEIESARIF